MTKRTPSRNQGGRPPLPVEDRRHLAVNFRVTPGEMEQIDALAALRGTDRRAAVLGAVEEALGRAEQHQSEGR